MRDARGQQTEADQPVLLLQSFQRRGELIFLAAQSIHRLVAGTHDLADLVAQDFRGWDHFAISVSPLRRPIRVEHSLQRTVHVKRHDRRFQNDHREYVNAP